MSVLDTMQLVTRPFASSPDLGYPIGLWSAFGEVTGDLSGGVRTMTLILQGLPGISNSNFYSLEQVLFTDISASPVTEGILQTTGMDDLFALDSPSQVAKIWRFSINDVQTAGPTGGFTALGRGLLGGGEAPFLGQPSRDPLLSALITASIDNVVDEAVFQTKLDGYYWGPLAMNTIGGLKRPSEGLFST